MLLAFIDNDLFTCRKVFPQTANAGFEMLSLFESDDVAVRQYVARLYNTLSSLQQGTQTKQHVHKKIRLKYIEFLVIMCMEERRFSPTS